MKEIRINSWKDFEEKVEDVYLEAKKLKTDNALYISTPLFRGQENAEWTLESSLDRIKKNVMVLEYLRIIQRVKSSIESFTVNHWDLEDVYQEKKRIADGRGFSIECYKYMTHLRHHGFPSPLLDWSRSPYVAAFFAFNKSKGNNDVAIFKYMKDVGYGGTQIGTEPVIFEMGQYVATHKRHHLQQCKYTFCYQETLNDPQEVFFSGHEEVFKLRKTDQDVREKYVIPLSQRESFLSQLNRMNINAYSLFDTEEGLMNKLENEEFVINELSS